MELHGAICLFHGVHIKPGCQYLGIEAEETMAFGDGENDWPMLEAAGIGVAMENGAPFLKERADRIAASNREEGVAEAIRQWVLI